MGVKFKWCSHSFIIILELIIGPYEEIEFQLPMETSTSIFQKGMKRGGCRSWGCVCCPQQPALQDHVDCAEVPWEAVTDPHLWASSGSLGKAISPIRGFGEEQGDGGFGEDH